MTFWEWSPFLLYAENTAWKVTIVAMGWDLSAKIVV